MKKRFKYLLAVAMPIVLFASCAKEVVDVDDETPAEEVTDPAVQGHPVTIAAGLPAETKITHVYDGSDVKPYWAAGDQIKVVFTLNAAEVEEVFTLETGEGTQSATFTNSNSQLEDGMTYSVFYPATESSWAVQAVRLPTSPRFFPLRVSSLAVTQQRSPRLSPTSM